MSNLRIYLFIIWGLPLVLSISVSGAERHHKPNNVLKGSTFKSEAYTIKNDIAFISVMGSRPDAEKLQGFKRAVLYTARGEVVQCIDIGRDSVYSLDKMIQENRSHGPLFIRMYRR